MLDALIGNEDIEAARYITRRLAFPDGETRAVTSTRLVWRWYDRALAYRFGPEAATLLDWTQRCADAEIRSLGDALGRVLDLVIARDEAAGFDYTDDNLRALVKKELKNKTIDRRQGNS